MQQLQSFFWYCAGANKEILKECPSETSKYVGIGASVLFTGLFAAVAAGYALYTVFDSYLWAIFFALLWGAMIFNLDRFIVSSMRKNGDQQKEWLTALPRLALAVLISIVVAKPLELKIFEKEIESELAVMQQENKNQKIATVKSRFVNDRERLNAEVTVLKQEILSKTEQRDALRRVAQAEADGTGGSMQRNAGPIYQIKKADADRVDQELEELRSINLDLIADKEKAIKQLDNEEQSAVKAITSGELNGLASRLAAMERLTRKSEAIAVAHIFVLLLFIFLETAPILVKLISSRGPYDYILKKTEYGFESAYYEDLAKVNALIKKRASKLSAEEKAYLIRRLDLGLEQT